MTIVFHDDVAEEEFPRGATYRTLVGDDEYIEVHDGQRFLAIENDDNS